MDDRDREILSSKLIMINHVLSELPITIRQLKPREINYDHINTIVNTLLPIIRVDVRPFVPAFKRDWAAELQKIAVGIYQTESVYDRSIGDLKSFPWYCAFMLANIQYNLAGRNSLDAVVARSTAETIAHSAKISQSNANIMFRRIYMLNISGTKPSGCAALIAFIALLPTTCLFIAIILLK